MADTGGGSTGVSSTLETVQQLEELLNANAIRWAYSGGYAVTLWATARQVEGEIPPTEDYDIAVHPEDQARMYMLLFGRPQKQTGWTLDGREVTFQVLNPGMAVTELGNARVIGIDNLLINYELAGFLKTVEADEEVDQEAAKRKAARRRLRIILLKKMGAGEIKRLFKRRDDDKQDPGGKGAISSQ
jgi:hypothetical protein